MTAPSKVESAPLVFVDARSVDIESLREFYRRAVVEAPACAEEAARLAREAWSEAEQAWTGRRGY